MLLTADTVTPVSLFWFFVFGSVAGVIIEGLWCILYFRRSESRVGVLYGPFNQIYGFGTVILTLAVYAFDAEKWWQIVLLCGIIGGIYEYFCSYIQEKLFGTVSWDYTGTPTSVNGRTSVIFAAAWGLLGLLWIKVLMPPFMNFIGLIPDITLNAATFFMLAFFLFDFLISAAAVSRQLLRKKKIPPQNALSRFLDSLYPDSRLKKTYPNMIFLNIGTND